MIGDKNVKMELHPDKKDEKISDQEQLWNGDWGKLKRALTHEKSTVETGNAQYREVVRNVLCIYIYIYIYIKKRF